jgi:hypothetical protein
MATTPVIRPPARDIINRGSSLRRGLCLYIPARLDYLRNLVDGTTTSALSTALNDTPFGSQTGLLINSDATAPYLPSGYNPIIGDGAGNVTMAVIANPVANSDASGRLLTCLGASNYGLDLAQNFTWDGNVAKGVLVFATRNTAFGGAHSTVVNDGNYHVIVGRLSAGSASVYWDGADVTAARGALTNAFVPNSRIRLGDFAGGDFNVSAGCSIALWAAWNRALTAQEIAAFSADPWFALRASENKAFRRISPLLSRSLFLDFPVPAGFAAQWLKDATAQLSFAALQQADRPSADSFAASQIANAGIPASFTTARQADASVLGSFLTAQLAEAAQPVDPAATAQNDAVSFTAINTTRQTDASGPTSFAAWQAADRTGQTAWTAPQNADGAQPLAFMAWQGADQITPTEWRGVSTVLTDGLAPLDFASWQRSDAPAAIAHHALLATDRAAFSAWLAPQITDAAASLSTLAPVSADGPAPLDWTMLAHIAADWGMPLSWVIAAHATGDSSAPLDWTMPLHVLADADAPLEFGAQPLLAWELADLQQFVGYLAQSRGATAVASRLANITPAELPMVRQYLAQLYILEVATPGDGANAAAEFAISGQPAPITAPDRASAFDAQRRALCAFLGVQPGPALQDDANTFRIVT